MLFIVVQISRRYGARVTDNARTNNEKTSCEVTEKFPGYFRIQEAHAAGTRHSAAQCTSKQDTNTMYDVTILGLLAIVRSKTDSLVYRT